MNEGIVGGQSSADVPFENKPDKLFARIPFGAFELDFVLVDHVYNLQGTFMVKIRNARNQDVFDDTQAPHVYLAPIKCSQQHFMADIKRDTNHI